MLSLTHIINELCPKYSIIEEKATIKEKIELNLTNFSDSSQYDQLLHCILYSNSNCYDKNQNNKEDIDIYKEKEIIKTFALNNNNNFNPNIAIKKIISSIEQNIVNKDVLLFLSAYYNINLYVYNEKVRLMHVYYIENKLDYSKRAVLITCDNYQSVKNKITNEDISILLPNILLIAMGLHFNKSLIIGENTELTEFVIKDDESSNKPNFINEFTLFAESCELDEENEYASGDIYDKFLIFITDYALKNKKIRIVQK